MEWSGGEGNGAADWVRLYALTELLRSRRAFWVARLRTLEATGWCNRDFCLKYDNGGFWIAITPVSPKPAALWTKVEKILRKSGPTNAADTSKL